MKFVFDCLESFLYLPRKFSPCAGYFPSGQQPNSADAHSAKTIHWIKSIIPAGKAFLTLPKYFWARFCQNLLTCLLPLFQPFYDVPLFQIQRILGGILKCHITAKTWILKTRRLFRAIHRVGRVLSFFFSRWNWDSPNTWPARECSPPLWLRGYI